MIIALFVCAVFLYWVALYLYIPTLPTYIQSRTGSLASVGMVLSMYGLWMGVLRVPVGIVSDWLGRRKPFILIGLALVGAGAWTMGASVRLSSLMLGRAITGVAATAWVPLVVLFASFFRQQDALRATAALTLVSNLGRILATGLTGWLNALGGYSLAFFAAAGTAGLGGLIVLPVREMRRRSGDMSARCITDLIKRRDVLLPALLSAVNLYADYTVTFGFMPVLAEQLGAADVTKSLLVSLNLVMVAVGNLLATATVKRTGALRLVKVSVVGVSVATGFAALAPSLPMLLVSQLLFGFSAGIGYPVFMGLSIRYVAESNRASAMGIHQAVYAVGMFAGPWLSGVLADSLGIRPMFGITAGGCLGAGWLLAAGIARSSPDLDPAGTET